MTPTRVVLPDGVALLTSRIRQIHDVLSAGHNRAVVSVPDWYHVALMVKYRDTFTVTRGE